MLRITFKCEFADYDVVSDVYGDTVSRTLRERPLINYITIIVPNASKQWHAAAEAYLTETHAYDPKFKITGYETSSVHAILEATTRLNG